MIDLKERAENIVQKMIEYSFLKKDGCDHVKDYPDFQTWRNVVLKELESFAQQVRSEAIEEMEKSKNSENITESEKIVVCSGCMGKFTGKQWETHKLTSCD